MGRCRQFVKMGHGGKSALARKSEDEDSLLRFGGGQLVEKGKGKAAAPKAQPRAAALAFGDGGRQAAARDPGSGKAKGKGPSGPTGDKCSRCKGVHTECVECPNSAAPRESGFDVGKAARELVPCWYLQPGNSFRCQGVGHLLRHHTECLS